MENDFSQIKPCLTYLAMLPLLTTLVNTFGRITWTHWLTKCAFRHQLPGILAQPGAVCTSTHKDACERPDLFQKRGELTNSNATRSEHTTGVFGCVFARMWLCEGLFVCTRECMHALQTYEHVGVCITTARGQLDLCPLEQGVHVETGWHHYCVA